MPPPQLFISITSPPPARSLKADDWIIVLGLQMARINYAVDPIKPAATTQPANSSASIGEKD